MSRAPAPPPRRLVRAAALLRRARERHGTWRLLRTGLPLSSGVPSAAARETSGIELRLRVDHLAAPQARVADAVEEVDGDADDQPRAEPDPRGALEVLHEEDRQAGADQREDRDERNAEAALEVRSRAP